MNDKTNEKKITREQASTLDDSTLNDVSGGAGWVVPRAKVYQCPHCGYTVATISGTCSHCGKKYIVE